jgi:hypothetical protein
MRDSGGEQLIGKVHQPYTFASNLFKVDPLSPCFHFHDGRKFKVLLAQPQEPDSHGM